MGSPDIIGLYCSWLGLIGTIINWHVHVRAHLSVISFSCFMGMVEFKLYSMNYVTMQSSTSIFHRFHRVLNKFLQCISFYTFTHQRVGKSSSFSKEDVAHMRIQYANQLFFHRDNRADTSHVMNYYVKVMTFLFLHPFCHFNV